MSLHAPSLGRWSFAVALAGVLALGACGGGGSDGKGAVASLSGKSAANGSSGSSKQSTASLRKQLLAYAQCMRDNGVDFPDPQFDSDGRPQFNRQNGGTFGDLRNNPSFEKAAHGVRVEAARLRRPVPAHARAAGPGPHESPEVREVHALEGRGLPRPDVRRQRPTAVRPQQPARRRAGPEPRRPDGPRRAPACQKQVGGNGRFGFGGGPRPGGPGGGPGATGRRHELRYQQLMARRATKVAVAVGTVVVIAGVAVAATASESDSNPTAPRASVTLQTVRAHDLATTTDATGTIGFGGATSVRLSAASSRRTRRRVPRAGRAPPAVRTPPGPRRPRAAPGRSPRSPRSGPSSARASRSWRSTGRRAPS